tara:strand:- start:171 stop:407 length:237 start_codon:yes stop_codon:yes gene_type:complete
MMVERVQLIFHLKDQEVEEVVQQQQVLHQLLIVVETEELVQHLQSTELLLKEQVEAVEVHNVDQVQLGQQLVAVELVE